MIRGHIKIIGIGQNLIRKLNVIEILDHDIPIFVS